MNLKDRINRFFGISEPSYKKLEPSKNFKKPTDTQAKSVDKYQNIALKFHGAALRRNLHLKKEEALPLLTLLHELDDNELNQLKQKIVKWGVSERQTFLNAIAFEESTPEEKFKYFEKDIFPSYWHSKTSNKAVIKLYQVIFRYSLLVFDIVPIQQSELIHELLHHLSDKDWDALKTDLPHWSSYQKTLFLRFLNNHPNAYKYPIPAYFKAMFPKKWQSSTTNFAVACAYRFFLEHEGHNTDYWWEGHGTRDLLRVLMDEFQEKDWQAFEEDLIYWSSYQLECLMEAIVSENYVTTEIQVFHWMEEAIAAIVQLYHLIVPTLKIGIKRRQFTFNNIVFVIIDNIEFIDIHFNAFAKRDPSIVETTIEILKLLGYENEKSGIVGQIWNKINAFEK